MAQEAGKDPGETVSKYGCPKCDKKYAKKGALENHCLMQHQWSLTKNAPASPKTLDDLLTMKKKD